MIQTIFLRLRISIIFSAVALCLLVSGVRQAAAQDYVVVVNKQLGIDTISSSDIKAIFTGKKKFWDSGEKVVFAIYDDRDVQTNFLKQYVSKTPSQFQNFWKKMVFTGKGSMPEFLKTTQEVVAFVSSDPGAISFMPAPGDQKVKTLNIN